MEKSKMKYKEIPVMPYGKYKGKKVDTLPMSYIRWILAQKFPEDIMECAREKVNANPSSKIEMDVTRHAYDSFSLRHLGLWQQSNLGKLGKQTGIGTFLVEMANKAWLAGEDVSKHRHQDEEIRKLYEGITFIFNRDGELRVLITVI